jgi:hypothetical protein
MVLQHDFHASRACPSLAIFVACHAHAAPSHAAAMVSVDRRTAGQRGVDVLVQGFPFRKSDAQACITCACRVVLLLIRVRVQDVRALHRAQGCSSRGA